MLFITWAGVAFQLQAAGPWLRVDLATCETPEGAVTRVYGAGVTGNGNAGVPVFGGKDCDGDGFSDFGLSSFLSDPGGTDSGSLALVFGDGTLGGSINADDFAPNVLKISGSHVQEYAGSEAWVDDVTGDGIADLLICRQGFDAVGRNAAGGVTILVGGPELKAHAATLSYLNLGAIPTNITAVTFYGESAGDRLGIWLRTGDIDGDGTADIVMGMDQDDVQGSNAGAAFVIRGGSHLSTNMVVDVANWGATGIEGHICRIYPPSSSANAHFGATVSIGDLDNNDRGEVIFAATINRAGGAYPSGIGQGSGGIPNGKAYIAWDDNFSTNLWASGYSFVITNAPGSYSGIQGATAMRTDEGTLISGSNINVNFGEEILAGHDYNHDGTNDLFIGDITGRTVNGSQSGSGHIFFDAYKLKGLDFSLSTYPYPTNLDFTVVLGPMAGALLADTASHGDYNGDGMHDLLIGSPCDDPLSRSGAGTVHILFGQTNTWPTIIDLKVNNLPLLSELKILEIVGVKADDILCYSAADGEIDGDGISDLLMNEMRGDNTNSLQDNVGNLMVISGDRLYKATDLQLLTGYAETPLATTNELVWTALILNNGPQNATNIVCHMDLPLSLGVTTNDWVVNMGQISFNNGWEWAIDDLPIPGGASCSLTLLVDTNTPLAFTNNVQLNHYGLELTTENNREADLGNLLNTDNDLLANLFDPDDDNDLMPDTYELTFGLNPTNANDATSDSDMDGANAYEEFVAGTIPTNGASAFVLDIETASLEAHTITWSSVTSRVYHIECADSLVNSNAWVTVYSNLVGTGSEMIQLHTNGTPYSVYRLQVEQTP